MSNQAATSKIEGFLAQQFPLTKNVGHDESLLKNGLIDSLGILEVVTFIEREFGITVTDEELLPENFGSIRNLAHFVNNKSSNANP